CIEHLNQFALNTITSWKTIYQIDKKSREWAFFKPYAHISSPLEIAKSMCSDCIFILITGRTIRGSAKTLLPPAVIAVSIMFYIHHLAASVPFLQRTEAAMFYVADGVNDPDFYSGKSPKDSIKIYALKGFFMNDEAELTEDFINNLFKEKIKSLGTAPIPFTQRITTAWHITRPCVEANLTGCGLNVLLILLVLFLYFKNRNGLYVYASFIFFQLFFWFTIFAVAYLIKMEYRHFDPMLQLYSLCNILFLANYTSVYPKFSSSFAFHVSALIVFILLSFKVLHVFHKAHETKLTLINQNRAIKEVNEMAAGKILMLDVNSRQLIHGNVFTVVKFPKVQKILLYDLGEFPLIPSYKMILDNFCHCNSSRVNEFYRYLKEQKENVLFVSTDSRIQMISGYLQLVHGINYHFTKLPGNFKASKIFCNGEYLNYYIIE
ncbi:MAG: hypothetical protein V4615_15460, partial [Bacteroidota bacterium]